MRATIFSNESYPTYNTLIKFPTIVSLFFICCSQMLSASSADNEDKRETQPLLGATRTTVNGDHRDERLVEVAVDVERGETRDLKTIFRLASEQIGIFTIQPKVTSQNGQNGITKQHPCLAVFNPDALNAAIKILQNCVVFLTEEDLREIIASDIKDFDKQVSDFPSQNAYFSALEKHLATKAADAAKPDGPIQSEASRLLKLANDRREVILQLIDLIDPLKSENELLREKLNSAKTAYEQLIGSCQRAVAEAERAERNVVKLSSTSYRLHWVTHIGLGVLCVGSFFGGHFLLKHLGY